MINRAPWINENNDDDDDDGRMIQQSELCGNPLTYKQT